MKIVTLRPDQFDKYAKEHLYRNYYQTSAYGSTMLKFGYGVHYLGFVDNNNRLIGATMIMFKEVFLSNKMAYAPRGILFDYTDSVKVKELVEKLKQLLGKQGFMYLKMDPYIPIGVKSSTGDTINVNRQESIIMANLSAAGFTYKGKNKFFENEKPRFEALVLLNKDPQTIFDSFSKKTRTKIRRAINSGIEAHRDQSKNLKMFYNFIKGKDNKPFKYYAEFYNNFSKYIDIYFAKVNTEMFIINSRRTYEEELQNNEQLNDQMQSSGLTEAERASILSKKMDSDKLLSIYKENMLIATDLLRKYPEGIPIAGALVLTYDNAAFVIAEGFNEKYGNLNPSYLIKWQMINDYANMGYKYINMNAVAGEFEKENKYSGLNETKLGFNSIVTEYIGEFDIVLNNFSYNLYKTFSKK